MKAQLFIDPISKKIIGINSAIGDTPELVKDNIYVEGAQIDTIIQSLNTTEDIFYIDGEITNIPPDTNTIKYKDELQELNAKRYKLELEVKDEYKILMDKIISGIPMEQAIKESKNNRDELDDIQKKMNELQQLQSGIIEETVLQEMKKKEKAINYKYYSSILLLIRDENEYLEEWLDHFLNVIKVDHIYIYDNESTIPVQDYLENIKSSHLGKITFVRWESTDNTQEDANNHFLLNYRDETRWVAPMDTDEFIHINETSKSLNEFLRENEEYASVLCQWVHYNANGHETKTEGGVMERFTTEADWYNVEPSGKRFIQTNRCNGFTRYNPELRRYCSELDSEENNKDFFQLNHYITKSYEEWCNKMSRGSCDPKVRRNYKLFFELNPDMEYLDTDEDFLQGYGSNSKANESITEN